MIFTFLIVEGVLLLILSILLYLYSEKIDKRK